MTPLIRRWAPLGVCFCLATYMLPTLASAAAPDDVPLIPRAAFFGNPEKARARLSPDGQRLAYVAPVEGVLNVWVSPDDDPAKAKPVIQANRPLVAGGHFKKGPAQASPAATPPKRLPSTSVACGMAWRSASISVRKAEEPPVR